MVDEIITYLTGYYDRCDEEHMEWLLKQYKEYYKAFYALNQYQRNKYLKEKYK